MRYDAVFFDLDGTVADSLQDIVDAVNHTMRQFDMPEYDAGYLREKLGWGIDTLMRLILPDDITDARREEILAAYRPWYAAHAGDSTKPFDGILPALRRLKARGLALAILSNKPDAALQPIVRRYFSDIVPLSVGERPGMRRKPYPDMLAWAAAELGVPLSRCLYVGDTEVDIDTARNAGIDCLCVTWGFRSRETLARAGAEYIVDTVDAMVAFAERE